MHEDKKPIQLAQEAAREVGEQMANKLGSLFQSTNQKLKDLNLKDKFAQLQTEVKEKSETLKHAAEEFIEKHKK